MKTSNLYKIECLENGKIYIGQTVNLRKRWMEHKRTLNLNSHHSYLLQDDWNKYGSKSFKHTVIGSFGINDIDHYERHFIELHKCNLEEYGYNLCNGGNKNKTHHELTRDLLRKQAIESKRWQGENNPNFGGGLWDDERRKYYSELNKIYWTEDNKKKHSSKMKEVYNFDAALEAVREPVVQLDFDGNFIAEFKSVTEASHQTGCNRTHIASCSTKKRSSCGGFVWIKREDYLNNNFTLNVSTLAKNQYTKIVKLSLDEEYIETLYYKDIKMDHKSRIIDCCNGLLRQVRGFKWLRYDDYIYRYANTEVKHIVTDVAHRNA